MIKLLEHGVKLTSACSRRIAEDVVDIIRTVSTGRGGNLVIGVQVINRGRLQRLIPKRLTGQNTVVVVFFFLDSLLCLNCLGRSALLPSSDYLDGTRRTASALLLGLCNLLSFGLLISTPLASETTKADDM